MALQNALPTILSLFGPDLPFKIVLVDSTSHITVYIDADSEDQEILCEICSRVKEALFGALMKVFYMMRLRLKYHLLSCALARNHPRPIAFHFKVMTKHFLCCSKTKARVGNAQEEHVMWLCSDQTSQTRNQSSENLSLRLPTLTKLGVPEQVSTKFRKFGILLLNDEKGTQVDNIEEDLHGNPERINTKILQYWLQGKGLPVTWETLIHTLRACSLNGLADKVQDSLRT